MNYTQTVDSLQSFMCAVFESNSPPRHVLAKRMQEQLMQRREELLTALKITELHPVHRPVLTDLLDAPLRNLLILLEPFLATPRGPDDAPNIDVSSKLYQWMFDTQHRVDSYTGGPDFPTCTEDDLQDRHTQFVSEYKRITNKLVDCQTVYNACMFPTIDSSVPCCCDNCIAVAFEDDNAFKLGQTDMQHLSSAALSKCKYLEEATKAIDDECTPWHFQDSLVETVVQQLFELASIFLHYATLFFYCRDLFTFSRYDLYTALSHLLLKMQFTTLADYVVNMPCFTFSMQDLLLLAFDAGDHMVSPLIFQTMCHRGILPVDIVFNHPFRPPVEWGNSESSDKDTQADRQLCFEYLRHLVKAGCVEHVCDSMSKRLQLFHSFMDRRELLSDTGMISYHNHVEKLLQYEPGAVFYCDKYVWRTFLSAVCKPEFKPFEPTVGNQTKTLHGLTFACALSSMTKQAFFVLDNSALISSQHVDLSALCHLYAIGQIAGCLTNDHLRPRYNPPYHHYNDSFGLRIFIDHGKEALPETRAKAMTAFYTGMAC